MILFYQKINKLFLLYYCWYNL